MEKADPGEARVVLTEKEKETKKKKKEKKRRRKNVNSLQAPDLSLSSANREAIVDTALLPGKEKTKQRNYPPPPSPI